MTASVGARTQAWVGKWAVFIIPGLPASDSLPFFPTPSPLLYSRHFLRGLWLSSSKPRGNACYAGYPASGRSQQNIGDLKIQRRDGNVNVAYKVNCVLFTHFVNVGEPRCGQRSASKMFIYNNFDI